jgi:hypothetical protein
MIAVIATAAVPRSPSRAARRVAAAPSERGLKRRGYGSGKKTPLSPRNFKRMRG